MPADLSLPLATLYAFLVVMARVSGALVFVPIPGSSAGPEPARVILILSFSVALMPLWPKIITDPGIGMLTAWLLSEAVLGITIGLVVGFLTEAFLLCGQMVGLQAGYSYASTVDPNTQSDSTVLSLLAQTVSSLLFFAFGLHHEVFRIFAHTLEILPPGSFALKMTTGEAIIRMAGTIFSTGLSLAMPVVALLVMIDISLALLGRINAQLQLLTLAFPAKMMTGLALLAAMAALFPRVYRGYATHLFEVLPALTK